MARDRGPRDRSSRLLWLGGFALCVLFWLAVLLLVLHWVP